MLGAVTVRADTASTDTASTGTGSTAKISGTALGGRRARVALVALALAEHPIPAERLAAIVWANDPPRTWQPALRGVIHALRTALQPIGLGEQHLITTEPAGYALSPGTQTDIALATADLRRAEDEDDPAAALILASRAQRLKGDDLLPTEDADWLRPHREAIDMLRQRAVEVVVWAAGAQHDHHRAMAAARDLLEQHPLDERAHRTMIGALDRAGDRAGAVQAYEHCRSVLAEQLGVDPSAETVAVYLGALRADTPTVGAKLPAASGAFLGREQEQRDLVRRIAQSGLITLTGRGGIGKSRLALRVATAHRALWTTVADTADDELVASHVALQLGLMVGDAEPTATLVNRLAPLGRTLLVLDGCDQVLDGVGSLVTAVIADCPSLTVLVTARSALGVDGEQVIRLDPLPPIDPGEDPLNNIQVQLLAGRVQEGGGELTLDEAVAPLVLTLCQRCAGLPLALELVAAQLTAMSPADLLDQLTTSTEQDQLTALLEHSYQLLGTDEAVVLRRCSVLGGEVSLPLVRAVVSAQDLPPLRVIRLLRELTDRGLLTVDRSGPRWRYRQDDDVQQFVTSKLPDDERRSAFGRLFGALGALLPDDARAAPTPFADAITDIAPSLRSLLAAAADGRTDRDHGLEIAFRLHRYWAATNVSEGRFWLERLLDGAAESTWTGLAKFAYGYLSYWTGDAQATLPILDEAVRQLRGAHDDYAARALIYLGGIADDLDRGADAVAYVTESVDIAERIGDANLYVGAAMGVGAVLAERGDPAAADFAIRALDSCRRNASAPQLAAAQPTAVMICWQVGAMPQARELLTEGLQLHPDGRRIARVVLLSAGAGIAFADGDFRRAISYGRTADADATSLGVERELPLIRCLLARSLLATGQHAEAADRTLSAINAARALTYSHPMALCLETASLVARDADPTDRGALLATAAALRITGDRPIPPALLDATLVAGSTDTGSALPVAEAAALAVELLQSVVETDQHAKGMVSPSAT